MDILREWNSCISQLDIKNRFCRVDFQIGSVADDLSGDVKFFLADTYEEAYEISENVSIDNYAFILVKDDLVGFKEVKENFFIYGFNSESFFDVVFSCFFLFPLADVFFKYTQSILRSSHDHDILRKVKSLVSLKPVIILKAEENIELGCSVPLIIKIDPPGSKVPQLEYKYQLDGIVSCTQQRIYGEEVGNVIVDVFKKGEYEAFDRLKFNVYKRNRVSDISLSEYSITIGEGFTYQLTADFMPENADNLDKLLWYSSDKKVANVSNDGKVIAFSEGKCDIFCTVEKMFSKCSVYVLPVAQSIELSEELRGDEYILLSGKAIPFTAHTVPENAIDSKILVNSSNLMVANIVNGNIVALSSGRATITVENISHNIRHDTVITVMTEAELKKFEKKEKKRKKNKKKKFDFF